ncbi:Uncharacterised protein [Escherichia coli]|nr:Uncharacterised protein [Escherichia coli]
MSSATNICVIDPAIPVPANSFYHFRKCFLSALKQMQAAGFSYCSLVASQEHKLTMINISELSVSGAASGGKCLVLLHGWSWHLYYP